MSGQQTLAGYDMVLTLSQNTINYQFQQLHKLNIIHKKWSVLAGNTTTGDKKPFHISNEDKNFTTKLNRWISLQEEINQAKTTNNWTLVGELVKKVEEEGVNFNFGWDANLEAPIVHIKEKESQSLLLEIRFKSGKLYYRPEAIAAVTEYELKNIVYAFTVPIGQLKINKNAMILDAGEKVSEIIRNSGLTEQDFTIESLFLNFENANISTFDKARSTLPQQAAEAFQIAVENYFNLTLKNSDNPYVLGYGVHRKKIKETEKAMFQPSSLGFSTSYSSHQKKQGMFSGLNFLMMLNDTKPPNSSTSGILPQSLLELEKDLTSTIDGVFAIQKEHFNSYVYFLDTYVQETFAGLDNMEITNGFSDGKMTAQKNETRGDDTIRSVYTITRERIKEDETESSITVRYKIEISIDVKIYAWFLKVGEKTLSTSGQYTKDKINQKGAPGYLDFTIKAGKTGRFDLDHTLTKPRVAFNENPDLFGNGFLQDLLKILTLILAWIVVVIEGIINQIAVDLGKESVTRNNELINKLNAIDVLNQTNKIILPLGKVYTFKNLRLLSDKDIVAYDVAYAPVVEK
ncbi:hypothetical protein ACQY1Q_14140 [Tenacibaculum sp. TC6]|uniref:hypothetical protein n=1 Tax=Tenacibaculum sp. TC6 TaxID=3423223 RepID=UPI003D36C83C